MKDMAESLRQQINSDLLQAMKSKDTTVISALRSVLSALDNASAVPISTVSAPVFGLHGDVPGKVLSEADCQNIIKAEIDARSVAAEEYTRLGRSDVAARLCSEQSVIARYLKSQQA